MQGKLTFISSLCLGALTRNKDFGTPLALGIMMQLRFVPLLPSYIVKQELKKIMKTFFDFVNVSPTEFIAFYCKIRLSLTYGILANLVTYLP